MKLQQINDYNKVIKAIFDAEEIKEEMFPGVKTFTPQEIAQKHGVPAQEIMKQLYMGIEVEYEHTKNKRVATEIALDHLLELPDYYDRLDSMERATDRKD